MSVMPRDAVSDAPRMVPHARARPSPGAPASGCVLTSAAMTARSEVPATFRSSATRPGPIGLIRVGISETLSRRRLIAYLVRAEMRKTGADTLLGNLWWIVDPLLQMLVYWILVGLILGRGSVPDYPLFVFAAILPWKWFESTVKDGVSAVVSQERLIKQIYFPKLVLPLSASLAGVVSFAFGLIPLAGMLFLVFPSHASPWILLIPVIAVVQLLFSTAIAIAVSGLNVFYRDISNLTRHALRFWFFLSPTLYGLDQVEKISAKHPIAGLWYELNPWTYILGSYRNVIYYGQPPMWLGLLVVGVVSLFGLAGAILLFKRVEPAFAKVL
jgi:ABC-type polysaccharide/polyol phosphate export permease